MGRIKLLLLYGGMSEEHLVSVKSATALAPHLDRSKYDVTWAFIGRDGLWRLAQAPGGPPGPQVALSAGQLLVLEGGRCDKRPVDVAFPLLHGRYGEDGAVQGLLAMAGIPCAGCGIAPSALCMDKALTYLVATQVGVRVPRHAVFMEGAAPSAGDLRYPLFVKPARSGSSFGVSKAASPSALPGAVDEARRYDAKVLVEEAVPGSEVGCALLGEGTHVVAGALDQIALSGGFFRIHQEANPEQGSENATFLVPAPIPEAAAARVLQTAKALYRALGCRGLARVDMFLTPDNQVVLNEINTMPGLTSYSRYPRMMAKAGLSMGQVADRLVALAIEKGCDR